VFLISCLPGVYKLGRERETGSQVSVNEKCVCVYVNAMLFDVFGRSRASPFIAQEEAPLHSEECSTRSEV
jgi:hypothetical protein